MLKRFENLGTALSRTESKNVVGGGSATTLMFDSLELGIDEEDVVCTTCSSDSECGSNKECRSSPSCPNEIKVCAKIWIC